MRVPNESLTGWNQIDIGKFATAMWGGEEAGAEALTQESGVESKNQKATEVVEIKLSTYNLKKAGQAPVSITPKSENNRLELGDLLLLIYKGSCYYILVFRDFNLYISIFWFSIVMD